MSVADKIAKLNEFKAGGATTEAEYEQQKKALFETPTADGTASKLETIPLKQKWWFQVGMTLLVIPIGLLLVLFVPADRKKGGRIRQIGQGFRTVFDVIVLGLWDVNTAKLMSGGNALSRCRNSTAKK